MLIVIADTGASSHLPLQKRTLLKIGKLKTIDFRKFIRAEPCKHIQLTRKKVHTVQKSLKRQTMADDRH
ncbi:hypothetical protein DC20_16160 [Rufibacter tibetensis]|uniref:Uncharacterized protein n=1 Tax=Rufibacter tibetensis TaxID=512763 RepID=A0A0P0CEG1_9BACT|nr:hypothetical protein DC20_16160 [Rufibacter tibetensis]